METEIQLNQKLLALDSILGDMKNVVLAFSGGVDSTFLLARAKLILKDQVIAVTAASETFPEKELSLARRLAYSLSARHIVTQVEEFSNEKFVKNDKDRCYHCKIGLFSHVLTIAKDEHVVNVIDGSNLDDCDDYRPGLLALKELSVRSPLIEAQLTKNDIRMLSKQMGLETWNKPSFACLSSRIPYGSIITQDKITIVAKAEEYLQSLNFSQVRVRYHDSIARIEVLREDFPLLILHSEAINSFLLSLGFTYVTMDLNGYCSGSMNKVLP